MGGGTWTEAAVRSHTSHRSATLGVASYNELRPEQIYESRGLNRALDPRGVQMRESRDSEEHPASTAVIVGLDVTGSMSPVLKQMASRDMGALMAAIYERRPISDPHVMCMGIGDIEYDRGPLQVSQFEADIRIQQQLEQLWLEGGGGGNAYESYALAWYFAARKTATDCFEKRGKRGYLFTIGDEYPTPYLRIGDLNKVEESLPSDLRERGLADRQGRLSAADLLAAAQARYDVFHVVVMEGSHASSHPDTVDQWRRLLGQRVLPLTDHRVLAEVIVSAMLVAEGSDADVVADSWGPGTASTVREAVDRAIHVR